MASAPCRWAISVSVRASESAPVEVSAITNASALACGLALKASSTRCGSTARVHGSSTITAVAPQRSTFSFMRPPNTPLRHTITVSPGSTRFTKQASMPTEPGPETGNVTSLSVLKARRSSTLMSSIRSTKAGSRWPMVGRAMAASTRGCTSDGPGPMRVRSGG